MKKKDILIISSFRKKSFRCKNKMLRKFSNTTLTDIILKKLKLMKNFDCYASVYDKEFKKKCIKNNVKFIERSKESVTIDGPAIKIHNYLKFFDHKYVLMINACFPFLKISTIRKFINLCIKKKGPCFSVIQRKNYFLDKNLKPLNFSKKLETINTKKVDQVSEFGHILYFFDRNFFLKNGKYWNWNKVHFIKLKENFETLDIDTEEDFFKASALWEKLKTKKNLIL